MVKAENIPPYLKANAKWCNWRYENRDSGMTKVPYSPMTNAHASVKIPSTFTDFDSVINALNSYDGIGIRVDVKLAAIDLDHCIEDDKLSSWAEDITSHLKGFAPETIVTAILFSMVGYFNGNNKTIWVMIQGLIQTLLVRLPLAYFMSIQPDASLTKIGLAAPVSTTVGVLLNLGFYLYLNHRESKA